MKFVFYDTEATGPEPRHDQMLHFAAVLADADLNEHDRFSLRCTLRPHQLPSAMALLLTGLSMEAIRRPELAPHDEMVREVARRLLNWSPAVFAGYSSFEFDEPLLAEALRGAGLDPLLTTRHGNYRLDVQRLLLGVHAFAPDAIAFASRYDGEPSFRLSEVARANGIASEKAHDALADVRTTMGVVRLIRLRARWLWDHMLNVSDAEEAARFSVLEPVRLYTEFHHNRPHHWLVTALGRSGDEVIGFDLAQDPEPGRALEGDQLLRWLRRRPKPLRPVKLRDGPFILGTEHAATLDALRALDMGLCRARASLLVSDGAYCARLLAAHERLLAAEKEAELELPASLDDRAIAARLLADDKSPWMTLNKAFEEADKAFEHASPEDAARLEGLLDYLRGEMAWAEALAGSPQPIC